MKISSSNGLSYRLLTRELIGESIDLATPGAVGPTGGLPGGAIPLGLGGGCVGVTELRCHVFSPAGLSAGPAGLAVSVGLLIDSLPPWSCGVGGLSGCFPGSRTSKKPGSGLQAAEVETLIWLCSHWLKFVPGLGQHQE